MARLQTAEFYVAPISNMEVSSGAGVVQIVKNESSDIWATEEIPTGLINGVNKIYTTEQSFKDNTIIMDSAIKSGGMIVVDYMKNGE